MGYGLRRSPFFVLGNEMGNKWADFEGYRRAFGLVGIGENSQIAPHQGIFHIQSDEEWSGSSL